MVELPADSQNAQGSRETREGRAIERRGGRWRGVLRHTRLGWPLWSSFPFDAGAFDHSRIRKVATSVTRLKFREATVEK